MEKQLIYEILQLREGLCMPQGGQGQETEQTEGEHSWRDLIPIPLLREDSDKIMKEHLKTYWW